jgi:hypothetical protein
VQDGQLLITVLLHLPRRNDAIKRVRSFFTAKPGKQSMIRRAALMAVQTAFRENGIKRFPTNDGKRRNGSGLRIIN